MKPIRHAFKHTKPIPRVILPIPILPLGYKAPAISKPK